MDAHRLAELRSLAYHRAIADRLRNDERLVSQALARVRGWISEGRVPFYANIWAELLSDAGERLHETLTADTDEARALRQATPFAGALTARARWRIWKEVRVRNANTRGATGWCLDGHDLVLSKYVAAREKDDRFVRAAIAFGLVKRSELLARLGAMPINDDAKERVRRRIEGDCRLPLRA